VSASASAAAHRQTDTAIGDNELGNQLGYVSID
jgi:hypothetical protein